MTMMSRKHQQTLKWATLLHDIAKRGEPAMKGRDHTHPFAGGMMLLKVFKRLGFLEADMEHHGGLNNDNLDKALELIERSCHAPISESIDPGYAE